MRLYNYFREEKEREPSLSEVVLREYEEVLAENKRVHNLVTELHQKHHDICIRVGTVLVIHFASVDLLL